MGAVSAAMQRTQAVVDLTDSLAKLFGRAKLDPKPTSQATGKGEDPLAPEVLKVLEKSMKKQKKKDKKKNGASTEKVSVDLNAAKVAWEQTEGRCSCVLGEEVWEGVNWRRGIFLFSYIKCLLDRERKEGTDGNAASTPAANGSSPSVSRELFD